MSSATVVLLMLLGQTKSPALEGVWGASRNFGPAVRGTLDIARSQGKWRAKIAQYDLDVVAEAERLSFELPADQGSFAGRLSKDGAIRGHWLQPPTVNDGGKFALPVLLQRKGKDRWQGEVVPLED